MARAAIEKARAARAKARVELAAVVASDETAAGPARQEKQAAAGDGANENSGLIRARHALALAEQKVTTAELRPDALRAAHAAVAAGSGT